MIKSSRDKNIRTLKKKNTSTTTITMVYFYKFGVDGFKSEVKISKFKVMNKQSNQK